MRSYNKKLLSVVTDPDIVEIYSKVKDSSGREYNRKISGYILDEFLDEMSDEDSLHFLQYMPTFLSGIQSGMFDTIARWLETINVNETLEPLKKELINCLIDADNVPRTPVEPEVEEETEPESEDQAQDNE